MLVGNKNDREAEREVSKQEAAGRAKELGICYVETNSLSMAGARAAFDDLIERIAGRRQTARESMR